ncbi:MAG: metallophosphoesterase family protein [Candidatus Omnitrophica bacterium]|nr:metallophosphoesterase family protein [Candidatus Omnitrophota bacterium]
MRYAVLSDIHGNLEAFEAVLKYLETEDIDSYVSLGDIVGYGANPSECIRLLRSLKPSASIAGNHDRGVVGSFDLGDFNEYARAAVLWTRKVLRSLELEYLKSLSAVHVSKKFTLVHGSLKEPADFNYIFSSAEAAESMKLSTTPLLFIGHTHAAHIYKFDSERRVVNAGSIGQPRDRDHRASFVIYDDDKFDIKIIRVDYDIEKARKKILDAGLPVFLGDRLREGV